jgi:hypothetical protein
MFAYRPAILARFEDGLAQTTRQVFVVFGVCGGILYQTQQMFSVFVGCIAA